MTLFIFILWYLSWSDPVLICETLQTLKSYLLLLGAVTLESWISKTLKAYVGTVLSYTCPLWYVCWCCGSILTVPKGMYKLHFCKEKSTCLRAVFLLFIKKNYAKTNDSKLFIKYLGCSQVFSLNPNNWCQKMSTPAATIMYHIVLSSKARYLLGNQLFLRRSQYIRIKNPLHEQSEKVCICF